MECMCPGCNLKVCIQLYIQRDRTNLILVALFCRGLNLASPGAWFCDDECRKNVGFTVKASK